MRLNTKNFKQLVSETGVTVEQLAAALPKPTKREKHSKLAERRVRNWLNGRDHPRAKASEIAAMAEAMGVGVSAIARYTSEYRWARSSPQKAGLVADLIRGRDVVDALRQLEMSPKRAAWMMQKALTAAVHDAQANGVEGEGMDRLVVSEARVDKGLIIKRIQPKDRGRAHPIQKKTCHITISVEEAI